MDRLGCGSDHPRPADLARLVGAQRHALLRGGNDRAHRQPSGSDRVPTRRDLALAHSRGYHRLPPRCVLHRLRGGMFALRCPVPRPPPTRPPRPTAGLQRRMVLGLLRHGGRTDPGDALRPLPFPRGRRRSRFARDPTGGLGGLAVLCHHDEAVAGSPRRGAGGPYHLVADVDPSRGVRCRGHRPMCRYRADLGHRSSAESLAVPGRAGAADRVDSGDSGDAAGLYPSGGVSGRLRALEEF